MWDTGTAYLLSHVVLSVLRFFSVRGVIPGTCIHVQSQIPFQQS